MIGSVGWVVFFAFFVELRKLIALLMHANYMFTYSTHPVI